MNKNIHFGEGDNMEGFSCNLLEYYKYRKTDSKK